jgi:FMN phosphatase YigB (HAD superfamily)
MKRDILTYSAYLIDMGNTLLDFHANGPSDADKDQLGIVRFSQRLHAVSGRCIDQEECRTKLFECLDETHRSMFAKALDSCGVSPDAALMTGDNPIADIEGAKRSGIANCLYGNSTKLANHQKADHHIESFDAFLR